MWSTFVQPEFLVGSSVVVLGALLAWWLAIGRHLGDEPDDVGPRQAPRTDHGRGVTEAPQPILARVESAPPAPTAVSSRPEIPLTTFRDVAGLDAAVAELQELVDFLAERERYEALGAQLPKGVLLHGAPGNGKTLLARALAGETGVPFHSVSAAAFVEQYVGVGASRIRQLFDEARKDAPAIVFIDELDAIGRQRSDSGDGGREFDHTLNQLLIELDGVASDDGILIIGATNRPELLDDALIRPGRFDRRIEVPRPDRRGRLAVLELHRRKRPVSKAIDWGRVASETTGLSGAELAGVMNEASLLAARRRHHEIDVQDLTEALARSRQGTARTAVLSERDKHRIALHEAGHAVVAVLLRDVDPPARVSIVNRGSLGGSAWRTTSEEEVLTRQELLAQLMLLLAGRAAEQVTSGEPSTRSEDDLTDAAKLARRMVHQWAMTGHYELAGRDEAGPDLTSGPEVRRMLDRAERGARSILAERRQVLETVARRLQEHETVAMDELEQLVMSAERRRSPGRPALAIPATKHAPDPQVSGLRD